MKKIFDKNISHPEIFRIALKRAKCLPENSVMVGDRIDNDILPAKELGMKTVWVKQGFAKYQLKSDIPLYTIQTIHKLLKLL